MLFIVGIKGVRVAHSVHLFTTMVSEYHEYICVEVEDRSTAEVALDENAMLCLSHD